MAAGRLKESLLEASARVPDPRVPGKGRELEAAEAVLESLDLKGQIVTGDALLAQRDICRKIKQKGASGSSG